MPWVRSHRRRVPYGFRTTRVRSHHRSRPGGFPIVAVAAAVLVILLLIALF
jgi:hypothetical protein